MTTPAEVSKERDALETAVAAHYGWVRWLPDDGSSYAVHIGRIHTGPDRSDGVLLVSIGRRTVAFQYPTAGYRKREVEPWTAFRALGEGIPAWLWKAAEPLLRTLGATEAGA